MFMFIYSFRNTAWSDELGNFYSIPINGLFYGQEPPSSTVNTWHDHDTKQLRTSNWLTGPSWLITGEFPEQSNINITVNELTVEINPVHPIPPLIDLSKFSSFTRVLRIMTRVLEFCCAPSSAFKKLVRQEQMLHCNPS